MNYKQTNFLIYLVHISQATHVTLIWHLHTSSTVSVRIKNTKTLCTEVTWLD